MYMCNAIFRGSPEILLLFIPAAALFCLVFNAWRLGKFGKSKRGKWGKKRADKVAVLAVGFFIIVVGVGAAVLELIFTQPPK